MVRKALKEQIVTVPHVKEALESIGEEKLDQFQRRSLDYATKFSKIETKNVETLITKLEEEFELEEEAFGMNHAMIGRSLAANWNLPEPLMEAIAFHHEPASALKHRELAAIVGLADYVHHRADVSDGEGEDSVPACRINVGHWSLLTGLFKDMDAEKLAIHGWFSPNLRLAHSDES